MSSDVAENLPSAPSTPTISVTSISDLTSTFEAVSMGSISEQETGTRTFTRDSRFDFDKQRIIAVRVQDVEFNVPEAFLIRDSDHFLEQLKQKDSSVIQIHDPDITSSAFASLLSLIFPPAYGINPVTTLTDWIDVLHLSSKWDYTAIRSAALQAIFPLASCVDKIVLAREYSLNDWMPSAVGELVTRKAGLTLDEGHRLGMEVVIAVAEARIDASKLARSPQKVDDVAKALSHALSTRGPYLVNEDALTDPAEAASKPFIQLSPNEDGSLIDNTVSDDDQRRLNEWAINALEHMAAGQQRILMHVQEYHSHVTAAVIAVLNSLWHEHDKCWKAPNRNTRLDITPHRSTTPSTFALLRTCSSVIDLDALIKDFCLERINGWVTVGGMATMPPRPFASALSQFDSGCTYSDANIISRASIDKLSLANDFIDMITTARAVRYVLDNAVVNHSGISKLVFANFWDKLLQLLHGMWAKQALEVANAIRVTLILMGRCASTNRACKEIEYFYEEVNKRAEGNSPAVQCLKAILKERPWAED